MTWHHLLNWLPSRTARRTRRARPGPTPWRFVRPRLEALEDRTLFATSLGTALFYNELIFGSKTAGTGQVAGRLAVGENATFPVSYGVGNTLPQDPTRDDLIVGGNLINQASWQVNANAVYGGTITGGNTLFHANGTTRQQSPILLSPATGNAVTAGGQSFNQLQQELVGKSASWGGLPDQGVVTKAVINSTLTLVGNNPTLNVFNLTAAQWATAARSITAPAGATVLINVAGATQDFLGGMNLRGTDAGHVLMNFFQATTFTSHNILFNGTVLAPLAAATLNNDTFNGEGVFGGDVNQQSVGFNNDPFTGMLPDVTPPAVTITTAPSPTAVTLGPNPVTLKDSATLSGSSSAGTITWELFFNGGTTPVHTEALAVSGDGTYTTPTGFTLPTDGSTVTGTYQWDAVFIPNTRSNDLAIDFNDPNEQVTVSPASPTIVTTASPDVTLTPSNFAVFSTGVDANGNPLPGGSNDPHWTVADLTTLSSPAAAAVVGSPAAIGWIGNTSSSNWVSVNGAGRPNSKDLFEYQTTFNVTDPSNVQLTLNVADDDKVTAILLNGLNTGLSTGGVTWTRFTPFTLSSGFVAGANTLDFLVENSGAGASGLQVQLTASSPAILTDTAVLSGSYFPTGNIVFTLTGPGGFSQTQTVAVDHGNGSYGASIALPTTGTVAGTYTWTAHYSGDGNNNAANDQGGATEQTMVGPASPTLRTNASLRTLTLPAPVPTVLTDTANLAGGYFPVGEIAFTLTGPGGFSFTKDVTVSGNGAYSASTTLPTTGTVAGTYTWTARYTGDLNNNAASDQGGADERTTVSPASPTLRTNASPRTLTLPAPVPTTLTDTATLSGGFNPTGSIDFTLTGPGGFSFTKDVTVSGNGAYSASTTLPTTGTVAGTYTWTAHYTGDANNTAADDQGGADERTTVSPASPTLTTTPIPTAVTLGDTAPPVLTDSATLSGGFDPTGTITFALFQGSTLVDTETATVTGNGTYATPTGFTLPSGGAAAGAYQWVAVYGGDANNAMVSDSNPAAEQVTVSPANPTLTTTPSPTAVTLGDAAPPTLTDSATLSGGFDPTGTITFALFQGSTLVDTETATVTGNGTYATPTGFTLPSGGAAAGAYQWVAVYGGDANNAKVSDGNPVAEQVTVNPASPTLVTTASPSTVTLPAPTPTTLTDSAVLSGGFNPTGNIVFTLTSPGGATVDTETVAVTGNGTYTTPTGFTLPTTGTVAGTYTWTAQYSGDPNNAAADDQGGTAEQTVVGQASLSLVTTASPNVTLPPRPPGTVTLSDSAFLSGGLSPTGRVVFRLTGPGGFVFTQTDKITGNGTYTASKTLPTTGTVAGTYTWTARYSGDANNKAANDQGGPAERTVVSPARPALETLASPLATTLPSAPPGTVTLRDSALLFFGYHPTGNVVFKLTGPGGFSFTTTDPVNGNGTYTASKTLPTTGTVAGTYTWTAHYSGDPNNAAVNDQGGADEQTLVSPASPTIMTTASPNVTLPPGPSGTVTLSDSALLSGGYHPTGTIAFTLTGPGGFSYSQTDTVSGNGTYTASDTLPTLGTVAGTYTWTAQYSGNANNTAADDQGVIAEQTLVNPAGPTLVTTAGSALRRGTGPTTLTDTAVLSGGYFPTGTIVFTLSGPAGFSFTTTDTVSGNGTYTATAPLPTTGTLAGTYTWTAHYSGDANNNSADDQGGTDEQVTVAPVSPTVTTTPSPSTANLGARLQDTATLTGGFNPVGTITFRLYAPGVDPTAGPVAYTEIVTGVDGNGTYHTTVGFVSNATGIWHWVATYNGDQNNNLASNDPLDEPVTIAPAADIALTKAVQPSQVMFGENVTFTLIVHNKGPDAATGVFVDDPLPPGLAFVAVSPSQGTFAPGTGLWVVGTLADGATATLQLTYRVAAFGPIVNRAEAGADQFDPNLSNNVASAAVTGTNPAPIISKRSFLSSSDPIPAPLPAAGPARPLPALATVSADIAFIDGLYEAALGREAKAAELAYWVSQLLQGVSRAAVARRV